MNYDKLIKLMELYMAELIKECARHHRGWLMHPQDTAEAKALRVATKVQGFIVGGHAELAPFDGASMSRACKRLGVESTTEGVMAWLSV